MTVPAGQPPADAPGLWARSWALPTGRGYGVRINIDDRSWTLGRDRAVAYATLLVQRATEAEHDVAVYRLFTERLRMTPDLAAQFLGRDVRPDRPLVHDASEPLQLTPGVAFDAETQTVRPFIAMHLDGTQVGQLTPADARQHALAVLQCLAAADLDTNLRRVLVGPVGIDEGRASAVIAHLPEHWPAEEDPRSAGQGPAA